MSCKTFFADNYIFHVDYDRETDLYDVGMPKETLIYQGPPDAHRKVLYTAIELMVRENKLPESILEVPVGSYQEVGDSTSGLIH